MKSREPQTERNGALRLWRDYVNDGKKWCDFANQDSGRKLQD